MRVSALVASLLVAAALPAGAARTDQPVPAPGARVVDAQWEVEDGATRRVGGARAAFAERPGPDTHRAFLREGLDRAGFAGGEIVIGPAGLDVVVRPVGDLDGDKLRDLVEIVADPDAEQSLVRARRGADGRALWTRTVPGYAFVRPARVGATGGQGVVLVNGEYASNAAGETDTVTMTAIDARGTTLWTHTFHGAYTDTPASFGGTGLLGISGWGDALAGPADDGFVAIYDFAFHAAGIVATASNFVVDGGTGTMTPIGPVEHGVDSFPDSYVVPDLTGDRLVDLVLVSRHDGEGGSHRITAYDGLGVPKWVRADVVADFVDGLGDVNGDGRADVSAGSFGWVGEAETVLLSGLDGKTLATVVGGWSYPLGDVDRDGKADVGTATTIFDGKGTGFWFRAFRGDGTRLYERKVTRPTPSGDGFGKLGVGSVGDVHGDGIEDLFFEISVFGKGGGGTTQGIADGRTGATVHSRPVGTGLYEAVDARGADFAQTKADKPGTVSVTAQQGSTGLPLWQSTIKHPQAGGTGRPYAATLDGDKCADVLITSSGSSTALVLAIRGRDGKLMWGRELTATGERPFAGLVPGADRNKGC